MECNGLKKDVRNLGREKHKKPDDNLLKQKYHEKLKEYKSKCKNKKNMFWENTLKEIDSSLNDPNTFWKKWKKLDERHISSSKPNVTGEEWHNFFRNLHTETNVSKPEDNQVPTQNNIQHPENNIFLPKRI